MPSSSTMFLMFLVLLFVQAQSVSVPKSEPEQVEAAISALDSDGDFTTFLSLLKTFDAVRVFESLSQMTIFAPTDSAFDNNEDVQIFLSSITAEQKLQLLEFHALPYYSTFGQLVYSLDKPIPTVASGKHPKGFTLEIQVGESGDYIINTTSRTSVILSEAYDAYPVMVYVISDALIPDDIEIPTPGQPPVTVGSQAIGAMRVVHYFQQFLYLLENTGVIHDIESASYLTLFAPTDLAFRSPSVPGALQKLNNEQLTKVLKYHLVPGYYAPWVLRLIKSPLKTLATMESGGDYQLKLAYKGDLNEAVQTGVVESYIKRTLFNHRPLVVYTVSKVLLPPEIFHP